MAEKLKRLTVGRKRSYLRRGASCPYCRSESITGESIEIDGTSAWQEVDCQECGRCWRDVYRLAGVEEMDK